VVFLTVLAPSSPTLHGRRLVFEQNFAKVRSINENIWSFNDGPVYNAELEKYTNKAGRNALIERGALVLEARKKNGVITSARLESYAHWRHPYVEVVAKVPNRGKGTWPAIWMLGQSLRSAEHAPGHYGWPDCGEIDIMEHVSADPDNFHFSLHCKSLNFMRSTQRTKHITVKDAGAFHTFAVDVRQDVITFLYDGKPAYVAKKDKNGHDDWPFDDSFYLILNLAIGGTWGGSKGVDESIFPSRFEIKSVRVYE
jgi:beta-glucanase (GH16 family)